MSVSRDIFIGVADINALAIAAIPAGSNHSSLADRSYSGADGRSKIRAVMRAVGAQDGMKAVIVKTGRDAETPIQEGCAQKCFTHRHAVGIKIFQTFFSGGTV